MTDIIERAEKALDEYAKVRENVGATIAKDIFASEARTLIPEAVEEIKRLRKLLTDIQSSQHYTYYGKDLKPVLARDLEDRAEAAEAKLAKAVEALQNVIGEYDLFRKDEYERGLAPLDDEIHEARTTLAELTGGKDE